MELTLRHYVWMMRITLLICVVSVGLTVSMLLFRNPPWNPLGEYPTQTVRHVKDGFVEVTATKCAHRDTKVRGSFSWQSIKPKGVFVLGGTGSSVRTKGCEHFVFNNAIPDKVKDVTEKFGTTTWVISGTETPYKDNGKQGTPKVWQTEQFTVEKGDL